jgi:eukaryotic-like serine/threonine-protein kinase
MMPERSHQVTRAFEAARELDTEQRRAFLAKLSSDDPSLRSEVETLLTKDGAQANTRPSPSGAATYAGKRIGDYQIVRVLGEGGMGAVFEAEQEHPRRMVALKVIKPGLANTELLRRFELESQVLARLQHPGIAQIYEAGAADAGFGPQPYFAMEFIRGAPLREYAASHQLSIRKRLELMARVCDAVEHAHQRGIIHRDLKPGNIMVDETGQPKIVDFGVARVTDSDVQATRQTDVGQLIGTLAYMSPEQVASDPLELDTRSDVYALGVILYELLANRLPYQLSRYLHEAVRAIKEKDPSKLSSISRTYRGDVETIVAKALEKDKTRRYSSAAALSADIRRYLADEPITARPASTPYQLRKLARRHKALVLAAAAVLAVLVAGVIVSTTEAISARRAEQTAQAVNDFLQNDLLAQASASTQASPSTKPDRDLKVRTVLDRAAARIEGKFNGQPEVEAAIRDTMGQTYMDLGLYPEARTQAERALDLHRRALGAKNPKTLKAMSRLAVIARRQGKYPEAEALLSQSLAIQRPALGPEHPDTLLSMNALANLYGAEGKYSQAEELNGQILEIRRRVLGPDDPDTLKTMNNLAVDYGEQGKYEQAEALYSQILEVRRRVLGPEHPSTLMSMHNLAIAYYGEGKYAQTEALFSQALETQGRALGPEHPDTLLSMSNLASVYNADGKFAQAEALHTRALEVRRRELGPEHPDALLSMNNLANVYAAEGKYGQAEALHSQALEIQRRSLGPEHPDAVASMVNLALDYRRQAKYVQAEALFNEALGTAKRALSPEHRYTLEILSGLGSVYQQQGKYALSETYAAQALAGRRHALGAEHPDTIASATELALAFVSEKKFIEAEPLAREAVEFYGKKQPDDWRRFGAASLLGASLSGQKKFADAETLLLQGYQGMLARKERIAVPNRSHLDRAHDWLIQLYREWEKPEKVAEWRTR